MHLQEQFNQKVKLRQTYKEGNKVSQSRSVILQSQNRVDTLQKHCILRYPFPAMKPLLRTGLLATKLFGQSNPCELLRYSEQFKFICLTTALNIVKLKVTSGIN